MGEFATGAIYEEVPLTQHFTGDTTTNNAQLAHRRAKQDPENYREVADDAGHVCPEYKQIGLILKKELRNAIKKSILTG